MGCCCQKTVEQTRKIHFNRDNNKDVSGNKVETTRYTWWSFLPKAIIIQFMRPANFVYLLAAVLQSIDIISSLNPITAIAPFVFVIGISLIREGYQDYRRYKTDKQINHRTTHRLINEAFFDVPWEQVCVGDILKIKNKETIPADILLLHTSQQNSLCYVQTANLDGQTNLKARYAHVQSIKVFPELFEKVSGSLQIDSPNSDLHNFSGYIKVQEQPEKHIDFENIILRQTILKNTDEVVGVVIYAGYDTKIVQNQGKVQTKVSHVQKKVNIIQLILLVILILMAATCSIGFSQYHTVRNERSALYYLRSPVNPATQTLLIYFSSFLLLTFLIPISLNVSIEVIKAFLGIFLGFDDKMYYQPIDKRCSVNNVSILEQLGKIDYVLTDKTGTLTSNQMIFKHLVIGNNSYNSNYISDNIAQLRNDPQFHHFWMGLVICHDVVCDPETNQYQGSSPDEVCFINFAKIIGYEFVKRTKNSLQYKINGEKIVYELLSIIPFDPRKRMSVIVKNLVTMKIQLYSKGADSSIFSKALTSPYEANLKNGINLFAKQGYRTLLFSYRELSVKFYEQLNDEKMKVRADKLKKVVSKQLIELRQQQLTEKIESNLFLLGATAIQDRLQDQVPETIARLQQAGIVVMMITGDKLETAQNIGYLANFIKNDAKIIRLQAGIQEHEMVDRLKQIQMKKDKDNSTVFTLIIEGTSISQLLNYSQVELIKQSLVSVSSVIFCRSSPKQKASIVTFVKQKLQGIVLAIGDGGNDVGMIQVANVGVGILGKQGNSASVVSDFSIGQFKYLDRLVLHHGRWFYYRLSYFFVYYGWKNLIMTLLIYFFLIDSSFSGFAGLSDAFIGVYNIIIGLCLVVYYAIFEQDINDDQYKPAYKKLPLFYKETNERDLFSFKRYIIWSVFACIISVFIFVSIKYSLGGIYSIGPDGRPGDFTHHSQATAICLSFIIIMVLIMDIKMYTWFSFGFVIIFLTVIACSIFFIFQNFVQISKNYLVLNTTTFRFWLVLFLNAGVVYGGKKFIDTVWEQKYPSIVDKTINMKMMQQDSHYIHVTGNASLHH